MQKLPGGSAMSDVQPGPPPIDRRNLWLGISLIAVLALLVGAGGGYVFARQGPEHSGEMSEMVMPAVPEMGGTLRQSVHEHADFAVFVNGTALDFNDIRFLSTETNERSQSVHLHAPRTNVAHLHREQTTFDEFFLSLGMELTDDCLKLDTGEKLCNDNANGLQFMVNEVRVDKLQFEKMSDMGRVLISFGARDADLGAQWNQVTDEACIPGENCADRLPPGGIEKEPCARSAAMCH